MITGSSMQARARPGSKASALSMILATPAQAAASDWWLELAPRNAAESALAAAISAATAQPPEAGARSLASFADTLSGSPEAGLARLAAGEPTLGSDLKDQASDR